MHSFDAVAKPAFVRLQAAQKERDLLAALRGKLLPMLVSGELLVRNAERLVEEASLWTT